MPGNDAQDFLRAMVETTFQKKATLAYLSLLRSDPWAQHIYGMETGGAIPPIPHLCPDYCGEFYDACAMVPIQVHFVRPSNSLKTFSLLLTEFTLERSSVRYSLPRQVLVLQVLRSTSVPAMLQVTRETKRGKRNHI